MCRLVLAFILLTLHALTAAPLKIAALHPLLGDLAREIGGDRVEVVNLIGPNGDPHHFEPLPESLKNAEGATLYLLAGMGLEGYLPKLKAITANRAILLEVGNTLPALHGTGGDESHDHDNHPDHDHEIDPHWWHSIERFRRATGIVSQAMIQASPEDEAQFKKNAAAYLTKLAELQSWTRRQIATIPRESRQLATAHAAFNYFCKDYGFTPHPIQGLNREHAPDPGQLATLVSSLKKDHVAAIFPEKESNPKILKILTADTGIKLGEPLIADGTNGLGYIDMYRYNVNAITKALAPASKNPTPAP